MDSSDPEDEVVNDDDIYEEDEDMEDAPGAGENVISYEQPALTEEQQRSHHFPENFRCDACQIVVHNVSYTL